MNSVDIPAGLVLVSADALAQLVHAAAARAVKEAFAEWAAACDERPTIDPEDLIGPGEVAKLLGVTERTLRRLERAGRVPAALRINPKIVRWRRGEIAAVLSSASVREVAGVDPERRAAPKAARKNLKDRPAKRSVFDEARARDAAAAADRG